MICPSCNTRNSAGAATCHVCGTPLASAPGSAPSQVLPAGVKLQAGALSVGRVLGQGGFGITYLGTETRLRRLVAIKEFFPQGCWRQGASVQPSVAIGAADYRSAVGRFLEEARTLARYQHPNIVRVYTACEENNTAYMVMEYLKGKTLLALVEERGRLPEAEAVGYILKVAEALAVVHQAGLLHRDVKPENVLLTDDGRAVLLDFGSAREFAAGKTKRMTQVLTPGYAPLEQYGQQARFGAFTDLYALGATLYHLLTGEVPVQATDRALGVELAAPRRLNPAVSQRVSDAVMAALAMSVDVRPQTTAEFLARLQRSKREPTTQDRTPKIRPTPEQTPGRKKLRTSLEIVSPKPVSPPRERRLTGHTGEVLSVAFVPSGQRLVSGGKDGTVRLWDLTTDRELRRMEGHGNSVWSVACSPDGAQVASGSFDRTIRLWDVATGTEIRRLEWGIVWCVTFSPDGTMLAAGCDSKLTSWEFTDVLRLWDPVNGSYRDLRQHTGGVKSVAFSPDGKLLASGSYDQRVLVWDVQKARGWWAGQWPLAAIRHSLEPAGAGRQKTEIDDVLACSILAVAFSPDGGSLASGGWDHLIRLWDVQRGSEVCRLPGHTSTVQSLAFSPDGRLLASASQDQTVRLWEIATRTEKRRLIGHSGGVLSVAFSPDGKLLASASADGTVRLWSLDGS